MKRLAMSNAHHKNDDPQRSYYLNLKKTLEINTRHPLFREFLRRLEADEADDSAKNMLLMMFRTATLRSGFMLQETVDFADSIEQMMRQTVRVDLNEQVELEDEDDSEEDGGSDNAEAHFAGDEDEDGQQHDEL